MSPEDRIRRARIAAYAMWAEVDDPTARTTPGRRALLAKFENQVDPEGKLDSKVRRRRAIAARKAHMHRIARKRWDGKRT